ncbi:hypothetical protein COU57_02875, partial [Candidatus Pacearchaeota archaeon CG10_big_fil_rev_8_21_14_0_10_32_14]
LPINKDNWIYKSWGIINVLGYRNEIYVITEAENWSARVVPIQDPLIIGTKGEKCYLVDVFNTTPVEEYVKREFISGRLEKWK